jgi:tetratricopeptide (TPR) repeat protein
LIAKIFEKSKNILGENDPTTRMAGECLAEMYVEEGQYDKAIPLLEKQLEFLTMVLGPYNEDTLAAMHELGIAHQLSLDDERAIMLFNECYEMRLKELGSNHKDTLATMHSLGNSKFSIGEIDEGLLLLEESLKKRKVIFKLEPNNPDVLSAIENLAVLYMRLKRFDDARPLLKECIERNNYISLSAKYCLEECDTETTKSDEIE